MLIILAALWIVLALLSPYFFTVSNLFEITLQTAVIAIIAAGETFVILTGGIDLSVGAVFACAAVVGGIVFTSTSNLFLALATTVAFGALLGLINGVLITKAARPTVHRDPRHDGSGTRTGADLLARRANLRAERGLSVHRPG